jgi:putative DNA primase/helicase
VRAYKSGWYNGVGYFFSHENDGMAGIDLDHCFIDGKLNDEARQIIKHFPNTYIEISPGGDGLHIYVLGRPLTCGKGTKNKWIEQYGRSIKGKVSNRYFTVTGDIFSQTTEINDGQAALTWLHKTFKAAKPKSKGEPLEKYVRTAFESEISKVRNAVDGTRNDQLFKSAAALKELCNSNWASPYISEHEIETALLTATDLDEKEARATISSALKTAVGVIERPTSNPAVTPSPPQTDNNFLEATAKGGVRLPQHSIALLYLMNKEKLFNSMIFNDMAGVWYEYGNGIWKPQKRAASSAIANVLDKITGKLGYSHHYLSSIELLARDRLYKEDWSQKKELIPFKNGVLNMNTMVFKPHVKTDYITWQLPYDYDPKATCQPIIDWLNEVTQGDKNMFDILRAFMNATLTGKAGLQKYLELIGPGGTGKSTFLGLVRALIGKENTHTTDLKSISSNRFETANFLDKRLALLTDSARWGGDMSMFKAITGQDPIRYERKGKDAGESFIFEGIVMLAANEAIQSSDLSSGLARRRVTINFMYKPEKPIANLLEKKLISYLPGLVNWCLAMSDEEVERVIMKGQDTLSDLNSLSKSNPLAAWVLDNLRYDVEAFTPIGVKKYETKTTGDVSGNTISRRYLLNTKTDLYPNYLEYCEINGIKNVIPKQRFTSLLLDLCTTQLGLDVSWKRTMNKRGIVGLAIAGNGVPVLSEHLAMSDEEVERVIMKGQDTLSDLNSLSKSNPLAAWVLDNLRYDVEAFTPIGVKKYETKTTGDVSGNTISRRYLLNTKTDLYPNYLEYCEINGIKNVIPKQRFTSLLLDLCTTQLGLDVSWKRTMNKRGIVGLAIAGNGVPVLSEQMSQKGPMTDLSIENDGPMTDDMTDDTQIKMENMTDMTDFSKSLGRVENKNENDKVTHTTSSKNNNYVKEELTQQSPSCPSCRIKNNDLGSHIDRHRTVIPSPQVRHNSARTDVEDGLKQILQNAELESLSDVLNALDKLSIADFVWDKITALVSNFECGSVYDKQQFILTIMEWLKQNDK